MLDFKLIKEIAKNGAQTQRGFAKKFNVSLGKMNAELTTLLSRGLIKIEELAVGNRKGKYALTAKGNRQKIKIAKSYLNKRLRDSDRIKRDITELRSELKKYSVKS